MQICFATLLQNEMNSDVERNQTCVAPNQVVSRLFQVALMLTSDWIKLRGSHAMHGSSVTC